MRKNLKKNPNDDDDGKVWLRVMVIGHKSKFSIMFSRFSKILLLTLFISTLVGQDFVLGKEDLEEKCQLLVDKGCQNMTSSECQKVLEKCEQYYREESARIEQDLTKTAQEKKTLQNKIYTFNQKIKNLSYQIYQSNLIIKDLGIQIEDTGFSIGKTTLTIEGSKEKLANILRTIYQEDQRPIIEILLLEDNLSGFFDNLVALECLNSKNNELLQNIKILKSNLEQQKISLDEEKGDLQQMVKMQTLQREESTQMKGEQEYYLGLTEQEYQKQLREKQETEKRAAEISARIFELVGVPKAPTFGQAYEVAKYVERLTGVRPAFLLAVLQQESAIGKNVGQCYLKNSSTGEGIVIRSGAKVSLMKPMGLPGRKGDVADFLIITKELGKDPYNTPVSCPMSYGWGGAMGPAQFIPTTWVLYKNRVKAITGKPADPWDIRDSFIASGLYLADGGASTQTRNGEWRAAMIYFSGSTTNSRYYWYANQVLNKADIFQKDIETLEAAR